MSLSDVNICSICRLSKLSGDIMMMALMADVCGEDIHDDNCLAFRDDK